MSSAGLVEVYIADPAGAATPILVDALTPPLQTTPVRVKLTVAVKQLCPAGWPTRPDATGSATIWSPRTLPAGTTITTYACEAAALIAAGAATPA